MTPQDLSAGEPALKAYVQAIEGWKASWIPEANYQQGTSAIIHAADSGKDQSPGGRANAGGRALYSAISSAGYGNEVTPAQCTAAAGQVLAAVGHVRHG